MKDSFYFPHDYHARHDPKNERLRMEIGPVGDGIYWDIVDMLYEEGGYLPFSDIPAIAKALNTTEELVNKVVKETKLFRKKGKKFYSMSLLERLKRINTKRRKARTSANKKWHPKAVPTHSERSAIKERKVKESKENNNIPPKIEDVIAYCKERNNGVDPQKWFNFYSAKGWFIGKNRMKDWKAAVRTWEQQKSNMPGPTKKPVKLQVIEMTALKIDPAVIKKSLLDEGYPEAEIDSAMGKVN